MKKKIIAFESVNSDIYFLSFKKGTSASGLKGTFQIIPCTLPVTTLVCHYMTDKKQILYLSLFVTTKLVIFGLLVIFTVL